MNHSNRVSAPPDQPQVAAPTPYAHTDAHTVIEVRTKGLRAYDTAEAGSAPPSS